VSAPPQSTPGRRACALGICDGSGFVIEPATDLARDCECRAARIAASRARSLAGRIPRRYVGVSCERPPVSDIARIAPEHVRIVRRYVENVEQKLDRGRGLWLEGDVGTGKTTLAMLVSKAALDAGRTVAIYSLPRLLSLLRESLDSESGLVDFLERLGAVDLLHIDDLGARTVSRLVEICGDPIPLYGSDRRREYRPEFAAHAPGAAVRAAAEQP